MNRATSLYSIYPESWCRMMEPLGDRIIRLPIRTLEIQSRPIVATRNHSGDHLTAESIMKTESLAMPVLRATSGWAN